MAGDAENISAPLEPPRLAYALLALSASGAAKAALIGDLEEEFGQRFRISPSAARAWYWRQASMSLPHLLLERMRSERVRRLGIATLAVLGGFVFISLWDIMVARNAARGFASLSETPSYTAVRIVYFAAQMFSIAAAGAIIAFLTFRREEPLLRNALFRLTPAALLLFSPAILAVFDTADDYPTAYRLLWLALATPSLCVGALGAFWMMIKRGP